MQNAEDVAEGFGEVLIEFKQNKFSISNTGAPFDFDGVVSLLRSNNSSKKFSSNTIGQKGLGFRSVLAWAEKVRVITTSFALEFSKEIANEVLQDLHRQKPEFAANKKAQNIAILPCPKLTNQSAKSPYATTIEIVCKESVLEDIKKQILSLDMLELLFLSKLRCVRICTEEFDKTFEKREIGKNEFEIKEFDNLTETEISNSKWHLFEERGEIEVEGDDGGLVVKNYELKIAYDFANQTRGTHLYSYFKTKIKFDFPCLIHATFDLTSNRDGIVKSDTNRKLVKKLADFIADTAVKISKMQNKCNYEPLKLVLGVGDDLYGYDFPLREIAKQKKIFPTIAGEYVVCDEDICFSRLKFGEVLNPETFGDLLQYTQDEAILGYIEHIFYDYEYFKEKLNEDIAQNAYSLEQKCELIRLVKQNQKFFNTYTGDGLRLLVDEDGNVANGLIFERPQNEIKLPKFVHSVSFLHPQMQENLAQYSKNLSENYNEFGLFKYDLITLFAKTLIDLKDAKTKENVVEFLLWLFNFYQNDEYSSKLSIQKQEIPVICANGEIKNVNECYFGVDFDNEFGAKIISPFSQNFVANLEGFKDKHTLKEFYKRLGVAEFPRILPNKLQSEFVGKNNEITEEYLSFMCEGRDEIVAKHDYKEEKISLPCEIKVDELVVDSVEKFDEILATLSFEDIILWIYKDSNLRNHIAKSSPSSFLKFTFYKKISSRHISHKDLPSFIKYQISRANWIKIDDEKVAPNACCLQERLNLEPLLHTPKINYKKFKEEFNISQNEIKKILVEVGVAEHFTDLSFAKQYEIAKQLHTLEKGSEIAPKIYSLMASNDEKVSDKIREDFKKFGRVLVKANNEKHFVPVLQAFWADKRKFGANILRDFNIFDISGVGAKKVEAVFGVNSLDLEIKDLKLEKFERVSEDMQREFEKKFNDLKPYLLFERYHNKGFEKDIELFKSVKIMLVYSLELSYIYQNQKRRNVLDEYEFFKQDKCIYIKIPENANIKFDEIKFATTLSEAVCEILEVSERNYRELIRANKEERKECIKADNDKSEDEIEEILQEIRKELDFESKRVEFWKAVAKMKQVSYENEKTTLERLQISEVLAGKVDCENINESQNINPLSEIFTALDIRLADFNRLFDEEIDFSRHWQREFQQLKQKYENGYLYFLFEKFKDSSSVSEFEESRLYYQKFEIEGRGGGDQIGFKRDF